MRGQPKVHEAGESHFETICSLAGAVPQTVRRDTTGWDCLVEFPPDKFDGPAESQPSGSRAFIQIKTTTGNKLQTSIKLSNVRRMAQDDSPWFIVLMRYLHDGHWEIYAKHFWEPLIADGLESIRKADLSGKPLNKSSKNFVFSSDDIKNNLIISWINDKIKEIGENYSNKKIEIFKSVGYENGYGQGTIKFEDVNIDDLALAFLGIGPGIEAKYFEFVRQRFGLPANDAELSVSGGKVIFQPLGGKDCTVQLRQSGNESTIALEGKIHTTPMLHVERMRYLRFCAGFVEILVNPRGKLNFKLTMPSDKPRRLSEIFEYVKVRSWIRSNGVDCQAWSGGRRIYLGTVRDSDRDSTFNWESLSEALISLRQYAGADLICSLDDLVADPNRILSFHYLVSDKSMRITYEIFSPDALEEITDFIGYCTITCGQKMVGVLVRRPVGANNLKEDNVRQVVMGAPQVLESYVIDIADEPERLIHEDFCSALDRIGRSAIGVADLSTFISGDNEPTIYTGSEQN